MSNPFEVSNSDSTGTASPPGTRPPSATVFGILNIVFALFGVCGSIASAGFLFAAGNPDWGLADSPGMEQFQNSSYRAFLTASLVVSSCLLVLQLASGIGLLKFVPWGRTLAIWYAVLQILFVIVSTVGTFALVILPSLSNAGTQEEQFGAYVGIGSSIVGTLFSLLYPVLVLIFMNRQKFKEAIGA